jgi:cytochrome b6-f complex iron-sulfur subunit
MAETAPLQRPGPEELGTGHNLWARREILAIAGWGAFIACLGAGILAWVRMMFPRVLFEPPTAFKAGYPSDYLVGEVAEKYIKDQRVWIVRTNTGFYAIIAICTHLGCTPRWLAAENKFKCPCHGSGYYKDGTNFEGPAPRPMEHAKITLADDGQIVVDKAVKFRRDLGEWTAGGYSDKPGAFLRYAG